MQPTPEGCGRRVPGDTALAAMGVRRLQHNEAGIRCEGGEVGVTIRDERIVRWDPRDLQALVELGQERRYRKGAYLMLQGDPLRTVHLLVEGWAKVVLTTAAGHDVLLTILGPADLVGDFEALEGVARSASVVALEPVTTRVVTDAQFLEYLAAHPALRSIFSARSSTASAWPIAGGSKPAYSTPRIASASCFSSSRSATDVRPRREPRTPSRCRRRNSAA